MKNKTIILLDDDLDFSYHNAEIVKFRKLWKEYRNHTKDSIKIINQLADDLGKTVDNVALLALDQIRKGKIE